MNFKTKIKRKKFCPKVVHSNPFPPLEKPKFKAIFTGLSVEIEDDDNALSLYENGCYGKGSHSRSAPQQLKRSANSVISEQFKETLVLDLEEAFFLAYTLGILEIADLEGVTMEPYRLFEKFQTVKSNFAITLVAYIYLKSKNWIIKSGTKFGGDFLIYKQGMRFYHASFVVIVSVETTRTSNYVQGVQRVAETSDKDILFLDVHPPPDIPSNDYYSHLQRFTVTETIPKRFDYKKSVQSK